MKKTLTIPGLSLQSSVNSFYVLLVGCMEDKGPKQPPVSVNLFTVHSIVLLKETKHTENKRIRAELRTLCRAVFFFLGGKNYEF